MLAVAIVLSVYVVWWVLRACAGALMPVKYVRCTRHTRHITGSSHQLHSSFVCNVGEGVKNYPPLVVSIRRKSHRGGTLNSSNDLTVSTSNATAVICQFTVLSGSVLILFYIMISHLVVFCGAAAVAIHTTTVGAPASPVWWKDQGAGRCETTVKQFGAVARVEASMCAIQ